ncbi:MAG: glutathione peroxidase [Geminicoccaceae bacterium]|nr:glutathione peroxidase [Geminicoccaceae bacterium]
MAKHTLMAAMAVMTAILLASPSQAFDILDNELVSIDGAPLPLNQFRGQPLLIVNTASLCGYTPQYKALQALHEEYHAQGLVVLGIPSNDFGNQEPGSNSEIKEFCTVNFAIDFPMSEKVKVKGADADPLFIELRQSLGDDAGPGWNFYKYLIDRKGEAISYWPSDVEPDDPQLRKAIEDALRPAS